MPAVAGQGARTCLVCGAPLPFPHDPASNLCRNPRCRGKYAGLLPHQICAVCGRPLSPRELATTVCTAPACHRELARRRERQKLQALREEALQLRGRLAESSGINEPGLYPLTLIPSFTARVVNLPERRRRAFRDHLNAVLSQATMRSPASQAAADTPPAAEPPPNVQVVLADACGLCQGNCCQRGGNHAYLKAATIRRYLQTHPGMRSRDVLGAYLARVGNRTYRGSCIFHQAGGCALPREMRSDTCNQYFCDELKEFKRGGSEGSRMRGFFAATRSGTIRNAAFLGEVE
jgi:predicted nucleic acid-binding Zn ribbon protein